MPRPKRITVDVADASLTGFASNVTGASFTLTTTATTDGLAHQVSIKNDSATDHSGKTVTLVGTDADGRAQTEVVTGPGSSATVESSKYFATLTSATPSATIGSDTFDIGWVDEVASQTFPVNWRASQISVALTVTGTVNYTLQQIFQKVEDSSIADQSAYTWSNSTDSNVVAATTSQITTFDKPITAIRLIFNSYSSGAAVDADILQADA